MIPFIFSGITHLGVLIFGGKNGFFKTFKPATYAIIIGSIYGILISVVSYFLHLINPIVSITVDQLPSSRDMPLINSYVLSLIGLISLIHILYTEVGGVSKFQGMTKGKALLSVILIPLILALFSIFLLSILIVDPNVNI